MQLILRKITIKKIWLILNAINVSKKAIMWINISKKAKNLMTFLATFILIINNNEKAIIINGKNLKKNNMHSISYCLLG